MSHGASAFGDECISAVPSVLLVDDAHFFLIKS